MRQTKVRRQISQFLDLLLQADIALYTQPTVEQVLRKQRKKITRITSSGLKDAPGSLFRGGLVAISDYCKFLECMPYSAILYDGAILQISYDFENDTLAAHRLLYFPCPFDLDQRSLRSKPIGGIIELYRAEGNSAVRLRSPLRFDYDREVRHSGHPAAHLTLLWDHCRWAVVAPLSLGHFVRFIFRHFYPHLWAVHDFIRNCPQESAQPTITEDEERMLHISCSRRIP